MRHRLGNTPKCCECYWYREKEAHEKANQKDGWCTNKKQCACGINGHKRYHPPEREPKRWNGCCSWWEDAELRLTHFEVSCRKPEEWRTAEEKRYIKELFEKAREART